MTVLNATIIAVKWVLRNTSHFLRFIPVRPARVEKWAVRGLGWVSWRPFGAAMGERAKGGGASVA